MENKEYRVIIKFDQDDTHKVKIQRKISAQSSLAAAALFMGYLMSDFRKDPDNEKFAMTADTSFELTCELYE